MIAVMPSVAFRRATRTDAGPAADLWLRSFAAALPTVVRPHTDDEVRAYFREVVVPRQETWVAEDADRIVGLMVLDGDQLSQLYLDPDWRGRDIGDRFVDLAKRRRPDGLSLWTFQVNKPAHRFYRRHGFVAVEYTDGSGNEEREPDVRYVWRTGGGGGVLHGGGRAPVHAGCETLIHPCGGRPHVRRFGNGSA